MSVFRKIFGLNSDKSKSSSEKEDQDTFLSGENSPIDEKFTINFKNNGGKFLYCETSDEVQTNLNKIIEENDWR
ncbi:MAG: lactate utilization protein B/C, partial [Flavobacteriaceae bacterium]|nr:lactate utilization protein B/C [Flavobacteriaceae bacterium]